MKKWGGGVAFPPQWVYTISMNHFLKDLPVAHRGLHDDTRPENSLSAYEAAAAAGYAIETDIYIVKDGEIAVFHDETLERMTGDKRTVEECTMSELKALKLKKSNETIPSLKELLACVNGRVPLLIEIKNMTEKKPKEIVQRIAEVLDGYRGEYAIQSFNPWYVRAYKRLRPQVMCGLLASASTGKDFGGGIKGAVTSWFLRDLRLKFTVKPDFVSYGLWGLPRPSVQKFKGIKLAWTVRSPEEEAQTRKYVDNIIFEGYLAKL